MALQQLPTSQTQNANRIKKIIVKPRFDNGGGGLVVQQPGTYTIYDADGNEIEQVKADGRPGHHGIKVQSSSIAGGLSQGAYFTGPDGQRYNLSGGSGQRHEFDEGRSDPILVSNKGATGGIGSPQSGVGFLGGTYQTAGGNNVVIPGGVDWNSLPFIPVDWQQAMDEARAAGDEAKVQYLQNIQDSRQPALDLLDTDVQGIINARDRLVPGVREQGNLDTQTNMTRAGQIDQFNESRLPGINKFNRGEVSATNEFNADQYENAVDAAGVGYRKRINEVLDGLAVEATGKFEDPLLDNLMTSVARGRGADIASSAGIGTLSGAGANVQNLIDVNQRIAMATNAKGMIPGIAGQAQQLLQPPVEQAKTQYLTPTAVPLNVSNIADRLPVTSNISAGATAQGIANTTQQYQAIPATTALGTNLSTQTYNSQGQFQRDLAVLNGMQSQATAAANSVQGGFNADKGDQLRAEQYDAFQQGLDTQTTNQGIQAGTSLLGSAIGAVASSPELQDRIFGPQTTPSAGAATVSTGFGDFASGISDIFSEPVVVPPTSSTTASNSPTTIDPVSGQTITSGSSQSSPMSLPMDSQVSEGGSSWFRSAVPMTATPQQTQLSGPTGLNGGNVVGSGVGYSGYDWSPPSSSGTGGFEPPAFSGSSAIGRPQFERGGGSVQVGNVSASQADYDSTMAASDKLFRGSIGRPAEAFNQPATPAPATSGGAVSGEVKMPTPQTAGPYRDMLGAVKDPKTSAALATYSSDLVSNWKSMAGPQQLSASGSMGVQILQAKGVLSPVDAKVIGTASDSLAKLSDLTASSSEKASANGVLASLLAGRSVVGTVEQPESYGGQRIVGRSETPTGQPAFRLEDGTLVSKSALQASVEATGALNAYQVLMSKATDEQKTAALKAIGVRDGAASGLISKVGAGDNLAALSLFQSTADWNDQTPVQQAASVMQTTGMIQGALSNALPSNYRNKSKTGASTFRSFGVNEGRPAYQNGNWSVGQGGVNYSTSVAGQDVSVDPITGAASVDFYGFNIPLNPNAIGPSAMGGPQGVTAADGNTTIQAGPRGVTAQTGATSGNNSLTIGAGTNWSGNAGVSGNLQFGNSAGAQGGGQLGGQAGSAVGNAFFGPVGGFVGGLLGSGFGSVVGNTFFGGTSSKDLRNGYRNSLVNNGFATKGQNGAVNIPLANGASYNLGVDGSSQFTNKDGSKRFSYEVDWTDPVASDSIPAAHLMAIGSGLDPSFTKKDTFNRVSGQLVNGITSNASSLKDSYANAKAFFGSKKVTPQNLGMRVEALYATNKISDQEYRTYIKEMNNIFGTKFTPLDKSQSRQRFSSLFSSQKNLSKEDKKFIELLQNEKELQKNQSRTDKRIADLEVGEDGGLPIPERYREAA